MCITSSWEFDLRLELRARIDVSRRKLEIQEISYLSQGERLNNIMNLRINNRSILFKNWTCGTQGQQHWGISEHNNTYYHPSPAHLKKQWFIAFFSSFSPHLKWKIEIEMGNWNFPHSAFSTPHIFHTLYFPHSSFSTPRTLRFPPNLESNWCIERGVRVQSLSTEKYSYLAIYFILFNHILIGDNK